jgi:hypothetical protein
LNTCINAVAAPTTTEGLHAEFLALLPRIEQHAQISFRHLRCPHRRADAVAEAVALAWKWFLRLLARGKQAAHFVSVLACYAVRHVRGGRGLCGQERGRDALSPSAQAKRGFTVSPLPDGSSLNGNVFDEALADDTRSTVPDLVAFKLDFRAWRRRHGRRDRRLIDRLMAGERGKDAAAALGLSPARVSQKRRLFREDWRRFRGEDG